MAKIIPGGIKDEHGVYKRLEAPKPEPKVVEEPEGEPSIDGLLSRGLTGISRAMKTINTQISSGEVNREVIACLKDCMTMLHELKKKEAELLGDLTDEELTKLLKSKK